MVRTIADLNNNNNNNNNRGGGLPFGGGQGINMDADSLKKFWADFPMHF